MVPQSACALFAALGVETTFSTRVSGKSTKEYGSLSYIVDCTYVALHTTNHRLFLAAIAQIVAIPSAPQQWHSGGKSSTSNPHLNWHFLCQSILNIISYRWMQKVPAHTRKPWRKKGFPISGQEDSSYKKVIAALVTISKIRMYQHTWLESINLVEIMLHQFLSEYHVDVFMVSSFQEFSKYSWEKSDWNMQGFLPPFQQSTKENMLLFDGTRGFCSFSWCWWE